jgi:hypothetical protein
MIIRPCCQREGLRTSCHMHLASRKPPRAAKKRRPSVSHPWRHPTSRRLLAEYAAASLPTLWCQMYSEGPDRSGGHHAIR